METKQTKQKARLTKQDDPYRVYEQLLLSLEEVCTICIVRHTYMHTYILFCWCSSRLQIVFIALFATALFRMVESNYTHQAKTANDRSLKFEASMTVFRCRFCGNCRLLKNGIETIRHLSGTPTKENETELSKHIWNLKDRKESFHVKWRILRTCKPYNNESKKCNLCLQEIISSFLGKI